MALNIEDFTPAPYSEYFQRSALGIPDFVKALSAALDMPLNNCGIPVLSLAKTLDIPPTVGPTTFDSITPDPVDIIFIDGPINLSAPKNAVPSVPNFNLFLHTAAAYSFGFVIPSRLSNFVLAKALSKKLPLSSPNISPTDFCPVADTVVSAANAGNTQ